MEGLEEVIGQTICNPSCLGVVGNSTIAIGDRNTSIKLYNTQSLTLTAILNGHKLEPSAICELSDNRFVSLSCQELIVWQLTTSGAYSAALTLPGFSPTNCMVFSIPNTNFIVMGKYLAKEVQVYNLSSQTMRRLECDIVHFVGCGAQDRFLLAQGITIFEVSVEPLQLTSKSIKLLCWGSITFIERIKNPDNFCVVLGSKIFIVDCQLQTVVNYFTSCYNLTIDRSSNLPQCAADPVGWKLFVWSRKEEFQLIETNLKTGKQTILKDLESDDVRNAVSFDNPSSPSSLILINHNQLEVRSLSDLSNKLAAVQINKGSIVSLLLSKSRTELIIGLNKGTVLIFDFQSCKLLNTLHVSNLSYYLVGLTIGLKKNHIICYGYDANLSILIVVDLNTTTGHETILLRQSRGITLQFRSKNTGAAEMNAQLGGRPMISDLIYQKDLGVWDILAQKRIGIIPHPATNLVTRERNSRWFRSNRMLARSMGDTLAIFNVLTKKSITVYRVPEGFIDFLGLCGRASIIVCRPTDSGEQILCLPILNMSQGRVLAKATGKGKEPVCCNENEERLVLMVSGHVSVVCITKNTILKEFEMNGKLLHAEFIGRDLLLCVASPSIVKVVRLS